MAIPSRTWDSKTLQNNANLLASSNISAYPSSRVSPSLPPRPHNFNYNSHYLPHSSGYGSSYGYGSGSGYNSYAGSNYPYRSSMYNSYAGNYDSYGAYGGYRPLMYGNGGLPGGRDDAETRFIQFAEEKSRNTFANVENVVQAFSSIASMMDNTLFAMTSSFRAILGVAENIHRLRSTFVQIFHAVNVFRLFRWFYRTFLRLVGISVPQHFNSTAWNEATGAFDGTAGGVAEHSTLEGASAWPTLAFLAALVSIPYVITKMLPKYEDKLNPEKWRSSGIRAKVAFDFVASSPNEMTIRTNDEILLAPKHIQEEMHLTNSGWAYATVANRDQCGVVPLNYIIISKKSGPAAKEDLLPVPLISTQYKPQKRVTFGENEFFDNDSPIKNNRTSKAIFDEFKTLDVRKEIDFEKEESKTIRSIENLQDC